MVTNLLSSKRGHLAVSLSCLLTGLLLSLSPSVQAQSDNVMKNVAHTSSTFLFQPSLPVLDTDADPDTMTAPFADDPLNSPFPIPWNWILKSQEEVSDKGGSGLRYYRSPSLVSPDGKYAAYARIQMQAESDLFRSRVTSVLFLENLQTGELRIIRAESPIANHLLEAEPDEESAGIISVLIPVSWSANGDRLLSRQVEGFFSTSDVSDYGVIWDRQTHRTTTLSPQESEEAIAILLGWDQRHPDQVLFRAGLLGEEEWPVLSVTLNGQTAIATEPDSVTYGQLVTHSWTGSQALR